MSGGEWGCYGGGGDDEGLRIAGCVLPGRIKGRASSHEWRDERGLLLNCGH